jgi:mannose-1-phosphate guanylyltransferase/phosphomannomutase
MPHTNPIKTAVIIEQMSSEAMSPLLEQRSMAMLPVAGKPLIQFWCEHLNLAGIQKLQIFIQRYPEQVREFVGEGERWGLDIDVITLPETTDAMAAYRFIMPYIQNDTLVSSLDSFPLKLLTEWIQNQKVLALHEKPEVMDMLSNLAIIDPVAMQQLVSGKPVAMTTSEQPPVTKINTPRDLWQLNMDIANKVITDPLPQGFEVENGLYIEAGVQIKPGFEFKSACRLGHHSLIGSDVNLGKSVVVGANAIIDESSTVNESVIFDNTYVGSHSELNRVIVDGSMVYKVDSDHATWIDDATIVSSTRRNSSKVGIGQRLAAITLFSVFLWPVLALYLWRHLTNKPAIIQETLYLPDGRALNGDINIKKLEVISLNVEHAIWRKILWLLHVFTGDLALVGTSALTSAKSKIPEWANEHVWEKPGVINLGDVNGDSYEAGMDDADSNFVSDAYYLATRSFITNVKIIVRWLAKLFIPYANLSNQIKFKGA